MYFKYKVKFNDKLNLIKIKNINNFYIEKNKYLLLEKKNEEIEEKKNKDILKKKLFKSFPPKVSSLFEKVYKFKNDKIPNIFYNHLMLSNKIIKNKKSTFICCSATRRIKGKSLTFLYYHPISKL